MESSPQSERAPHPSKKEPSASKKEPPSAQWLRGFRELEAWMRGQLRRLVPDAAPLPDVLTIPLEFPLVIDDARRLRTEQEFLNRVLQALQAQGERLIKPPPLDDGRLYCYWCNSALCEHSLPQDPREVFAGYEQTGKPRWKEFGSWVVEEKDARMDRLFAKHPKPLAIYLAGERLTRDLLHPFAKHSAAPRIIAQVAAGFFHVDGAHERGAEDHRERGVAVTAQLLERVSAGGDSEFSLHLVGALPLPHTWSSLLADRETLLVGKFLEWTRAEIRRLGALMADERRAGKKHSRARARARATGLFEKLPGHLEKLLRQGARRTLHAADRAQDPHRPTTVAIADALAAKAESFMFDGREGTVIVRGPRNRVHVFRKDATHVTSIHYPADTIRERMRTRRWKPLPAEEHAKFRAAITATG